MPSPAPPRDSAGWIDIAGVCSMCADGWTGSKGGGSMVVDHCHVTGFMRGWLCSSCNALEASGVGQRWAEWRTSAPWLKDRARYSAYVDYSEVLSPPELAELPIAELLSLHYARRHASTFIDNAATDLGL